MTDKEKTTKIKEPQVVGEAGLVRSDAGERFRNKILTEDVLKSLDSSKYFKRRGLDAQGLTADFDATVAKNNEKIRNEVFKEDKQGFEMYKRMTAEYDIKKRDAILKYEQAQVLHGLQEANKDRRRDELVNAVDVLKMGFSSLKVKQAADLEESNKRFSDNINSIKSEEQARLKTPLNDKLGQEKAMGSFQIEMDKASAKLIIEQKKINKEAADKSRELYKDFHKSLLKMYSDEYNTQLAFGLTEREAHNAAAQATREDAASTIKLLIDGGQGELVDKTILPILKDPDAIKRFKYVKDENGNKVKDKNGNDVIAEEEGVIDLSGRLFLQEEDVVSLQNYLDKYIASKAEKKTSLANQYRVQLKKLVYTGKRIIDDVYDSALETGSIINEKILEDLQTKLSPIYNAIQAIYKENPFSIDGSYDDIKRYNYTMSNRYKMQERERKQAEEKKAREKERQKRKEEREEIKRNNALIDEEIDSRRDMISDLENQEDIQRYEQKRAKLNKRAENIALNNKNEKEFVDSLHRILSFTGEDISGEIGLPNELGEIKKSEVVMDKYRMYKMVLNVARQNGFCKESVWTQLGENLKNADKKLDIAQGAINKFFLQKQGGLSKKSTAGSILLGVDSSGDLYVMNDVEGVYFDDANQGTMWDSDISVDKDVIKSVVRFTNEYFNRSMVLPTEEKVREVMEYAYQGATAKKDSAHFVNNFLANMSSYVTAKFNPSLNSEVFGDRLEYAKAMVSRLPKDSQLRRIYEDQIRFFSVAPDATRIVGAAVAPKQMSAIDADSGIDGIEKDFDEKISLLKNKQRRLRDDIRTLETKKKTNSYDPLYVDEEQDEYDEPDIPTVDYGEENETEEGN